MQKQKRTLFPSILGALTLLISGQVFAAVYTTTYSYNDATGQATITDPNSHHLIQTTRRFGSPDETGQLVSIQQQNNASAPGTKGHFTQLTTIHQDVAGHVLSIVQANAGTPDSLTRTYHYDSHWFLTAEDNPETGTTTYGRDALGQKTSTQVGSSGITAYTYDADGNLLTTTWPDKSRVVNTYDADNQLLTATKNAANGKDSNGWTTTYNLNGQVITATLVMKGSQSLNRKFQYTYDTLGHLNTLTYPDGSVVNYAPNALGQITTVGKCRVLPQR